MTEKDLLQPIEKSVLTDYDPSAAATANAVKELFPARSPLYDAFVSQPVRTLMLLPAKLLGSAIATHDSVAAHKRLVNSGREKKSAVEYYAENGTAYQRRLAYATLKRL